MIISNQPNRICQRIYLYCSILTGVLLIFLFSTYKDHGITFDETDQFLLGLKSFDYYVGLFRDEKFFSFYPPFIYTTRGIFPAISIEAIVRLLKRHSLEDYHLLLALVNVPAYIFVYLSVYKITKNVSASIFSFLSLLTFPRFTGDIFNNSKDIPVGTVLSIAIFLLLSYWYKKSKKTNILVLLGLVSGLLFSMRIVMLYFALLILAVLIIDSKGVKEKLMISAIFAVTSLVSLHFLTPYLHKNPLFGVVHMIRDSVRFKEVGNLLFEGEVVLSDKLPWYYLPKFMLITIPEYILSFFLIAFLWWGKRLRHIKRYSKQLEFQVVTLLFLTLLLPLVLTIVLRPNMYDAWRHTIFLSIPFVILSTFGFYILASNSRQIVKFVTTSLAILGFVSVSFSMSELHPYEYVYFNKLAGGLPGVHRKYETEYWGKSFKEAAEWINEYVNENDTGDSIPVVSCVPHLTEPYLSDDIDLLTLNSLDNGYIYTCFTRLNKDLSVDGEPIFSVKRSGVPLHVVKMVN